MERELEDMFGKYGKVREVRVAMDGGGRSKGFAFITMDTAHDAEECIRGALPLALLRSLVSPHRLDL